MDGVVYGKAQGHRCGKNSNGIKRNPRPAHNTEDERYGRNVRNKAYDPSLTDLKFTINNPVMRMNARARDLICDLIRAEA